MDKPFESPSTPSPMARLDFPGPGGERVPLSFTDPVEIISAEDQGEVREALRAVEDAAARGLYAVGYVSYEAAPAFDTAYPIRAGTRLPLVWFGIFEAPSRGSEPVRPGGGSESVTEHPGGWVPDTRRAAYDTAIQALHEAFARDDVDQVNYTLRLHRRLSEDSVALYERLLSAQGTAYGAYLDLGFARILSASPELFFRRTGDRLLMRPMKGTARRGRWTEEDDAAAEALASSAKDRAENLMTVDRLRAELERIACPGTVETAAICEVERYPTVFQLTTTITADLPPRTSLETLFGGLFPPLSVAGVPRLAAMQRIATLENAPREVYCGAIGVVEPGGDALFNVAIRTVWIDTATGLAEYGVGGGITRGSTAADEYDEVLAKAAVLTRDSPEFELLETLRLTDGHFTRLERHLKRLSDSARYFGRPDPGATARAALARHAELYPTGVRRVRMLAAADGEVRVESRPFEEGPADAAGFAAALARRPVSRNDPFLHHKTTHRLVHESRRAERPDLFEVLLWNEEGELTEFTRGNLVVELDGVLWTPPRDSGLLAGTFRGELLGRGEIRERVLRVADLPHATGIWLINSLREWVPIRIVE